MACTVCEHCQEPVHQNDNMTFRDGYSYHEKCHKCYVCSETNLHGAEVFNGVIFCNSCSQRIFQGCSTARRIKDSSRKHRRSQRHRSQRTQGKHVTKKHQNGILEMAGLTAGNNSTESSKSGSDGNKETKQSKSISIPTEIALTDTKPLLNEIPKKIICADKELDIGMITEVTQELLKQMQCPVINIHKQLTQRVKPPNKTVKKKKQCSDLRIAELGTSTEIANMALKHKSEQPVLIKSESRTKHTSQSGSLNRESDRNEEWLDSAYSNLKGSIINYWLDRRFGSILALPYKSFKKHILERSSLISISMSSDDKISLLNRIKILFRHEINEHQKRGLKRLYSTINRQQPKNKLGWLNYGITVKKRCKHFKKSHSYRCMRSQAMRLAGPTKSQLAVYRANAKNAVTSWFRNFPGNRCPAITVSHACGNSVPGSVAAAPVAVHALYTF